MSDNYVLLNDTQSPKTGKAFITIDGQNREMFEVSSLRAQLNQNTIGRYMLGNKMMQHKRGGVEGTGSATLYFMNSEQLKATLDYINSGKHAPITVQGYNEDPQSSIGRQEVVLYNVIFQTLLVFAVDDQSDDPITFDSDFTFDKVVPLSEFQKPANYR